MSSCLTQGVHTGRDEFVSAVVFWMKDSDKRGGRSGWRLLRFRLWPHHFIICCVTMGPRVLKREWAAS